MKYTMTIERTLRFDVEFEADDDEKAELKADKLFAKKVHDESNFVDADAECDYAVCDECGRTIVSWL